MVNICKVINPFRLRVNTDQDLDGKYCFEQEILNLIHSHTKWGKRDRQRKRERERQKDREIDRERYREGEKERDTSRETDSMRQR